jgi:hypothetical protein
MQAVNEAEELRLSALADDGIPPEIVEHRGRKYEVRPPTLAQQRYFQRIAAVKGETDGVKLLVAAVIGCTYVPGTQQRVFKEADAEVLESKTTDERTIVGKVSRVLNKIMKADQSEIAGNFDGAQGDSSNS